MENEIIRRLEDGLVAAEDEVDLLKVRRQVQEIVWMGRLHKKEAERSKSNQHRLKRRNPRSQFWGFHFPEKSAKNL